jgi:hypothetical protein
VWTFIIGLFVGGFIGLLIGGLACAASKSDTQARDTFDRWLEQQKLPERPDDDDA